MIIDCVGPSLQRPARPLHSKGNFIPHYKPEPHRRILHLSTVRCTIAPLQKLCKLPHLAHLPPLFETSNLDNFLQTATRESNTCWPNFASEEAKISNLEAIFLVSSMYISLGSKGPRDLKVVIILPSRAAAARVDKGLEVGDGS